MKRLKMKKPGSVGRRNPGRQQKFGLPVAGFQYTKTSSYRKPLCTPTQFYLGAIEEFAERGEHWAWGCCPFHDDRHPSFCMNLETGWYKCMSSSCGSTGGNILSFVMALHGLSRADALSYLEAVR